MTHQEELQLYNNEWNKGFQAFVDGEQAYSCANKSEAWNDGYAAARENNDLEIYISEIECGADYDKSH